MVRVSVKHMYGPSIPQGSPLGCGLSNSGKVVWFNGSRKQSYHYYLRYQLIPSRAWSNHTYILSSDTTQNISWVLPLYKHCQYCSLTIIEKDNYRFMSATWN